MPDNSLSERISFLERELLPLKKLLAGPQTTALEEQASIRRELNALTCSAHKLPFEVLDIIFFYAVAPPPGPSSPEKPTDRSKQARHLTDVFFSVILAAVCNRWRSLVFSTPHLWAYFQFPAFLWLRAGSHHLLSLYLHHSGHIPIHLSLSFDTSRARYGALFHSSLDCALISNFSRIRSLSLHNPPTPWLKQLGNLPFIVDLSVSWQYQVPPTKDRLQIHRCHTLSRLYLSGAITEDNRRVLYQVPASLTIVDLSKMPVDVCVKIMLRCPNLVEAYIRNPLGEEDVNFQDDELLQNWFAEPVVFQHLTTFLWSHGPYDCADAFLPQMRTPQLHTLKLHATPADREINMSANVGIASLIEQLPKTFKTLELGEAQGAYGYDDQFDSQSSLEHLILFRCAMHVHWDIFHILLGQAEELQDRRDLRTPRLKSLSIIEKIDEDSEDTYEVIPGEVEPLIKALEHRLGRGDKFKLELCGIGVDWMPTAQARLRALVEKGVELEIIEEGERVTWLGNWFPAKVG